MLLLFLVYKPLGVNEQGPTHSDFLKASSYAVLSSLVERHDYSKIVDLTFPTLDTEAGKLVAVLQQKYGSSISNFKVYEFGMYAPSVYAGKSLEFDQAFSAFDAQYSGASGDPYLLIARQLQGSGISMRFKVKLEYRIKKINMPAKAMRKSLKFPSQLMTIGCSRKTALILPTITSLFLVSESRVEWLML
ncbi:hypothetical protein [Haliscomenobacter sp.]|uniref:hypothetical protein n=1 Tax=Haliscomenobacter sp. TaxID=2717303 RepID=UPI00359352F4